MAARLPLRVLHGRQGRAAPQVPAGGAHSTRTWVVLLPSRHQIRVVWGVAVGQRQFVAVRVSITHMLCWCLSVSFGIRTSGGGAAAAGLLLMCCPPGVAVCVCVLQEVQSMQFNILVTTYETIMRDRWGPVAVGHSETG